MKGKNKLVPRLLGVTKESILRVDEKTKEVCIHTMTCWVLLILHISTLSIALQNSFVSDQIYHNKLLCDNQSLALPSISQACFNSKRDLNDC